MALTLRPHRPTPPPIASTDPSPFEMALVAVWIAESLAFLADPVAELLGDGFRVSVGPPSGPGVAVVAAQGRAAIAFLRAQHPMTLLLVDQRGASVHHEDAAAYLNAGADVFVDRATPVEIAAYVRALNRRARR